MNKKIFLIILTVFVTLLAGCAARIPEPLVSEQQTVPDSGDLPPVMEPYPVSFDGETFDSAPQSVGSLSPSLTEMLYDIGVGDRLVCVSDYCDYPAAIDGLAKVGSPAEPDVETISSAAPELLITSSPIAATDVLLLKQAGVRVLEIKAPQNFAQMCEIYIKLSLIFYGQADAPEASRSVYGQIDQKLREIQLKGYDYTFVFIEDTAHEGLMLSTPDSFCGSLFSAFGENLWKENRYNATEAELFEIGPDVVFYSSDVSAQKVRAEFPYALLVPLDFDRLERPSLRIIEILDECETALAAL